MVSDSDRIEYQSMKDKALHIGKEICADELYVDIGNGILGLVDKVSDSAIEYVSDPSNRKLVTDKVEEFVTKVNPKSASNFEDLSGGKSVGSITDENIKASLDARNEATPGGDDPVTMDDVCSGLVGVPANNGHRER